VSNKQYLVVEVNVEIPDSSDSSATHPDLELYGHSEAMATMSVKFELVPATQRPYETRLRGSRAAQPSVELTACTVFWSNAEGEDTYERDYELTPDQYAYAVAQALKVAKATRMNVLVEKVGA
jgi:hypothetical protein